MLIIYAHMNGVSTWSYLLKHVELSMEAFLNINVEQRVVLSFEAFLNINVEGVCEQRMCVWTVRAIIYDIHILTRSIIKKLFIY